MKPSPLHTVWLDGRDLLIAQALSFWVRCRKEWLRVPLDLLDGQMAGFVTDGGTIPGLAWPVVGHPFSLYLPWYVKHDFAWAFRDLVGLSFAETNDELHADLRAAGMSAAKAWAVYLAVQGPGRAVWNRRNHVGDKSWHYAVIPEPVWGELS